MGKPDRQSPRAASGGVDRRGGFFVWGTTWQLRRPRGFFRLAGGDSLMGHNTANYLRCNRNLALHQPAGHSGDPLCRLLLDGLFSFHQGRHQLNPNLRKLPGHCQKPRGIPLDLFDQPPKSFSSPLQLSPNGKLPMRARVAVQRFFRLVATWRGGRLQAPQNSARS